MAAVLPPILLTPPAPPAPLVPPVRVRMASLGVSGLALRHSIAPGFGQRDRPAVPLLLAAVLVTVALLVAPEQPRDQEAICHRHSGEVACRVW